MSSDSTERHCIHITRGELQPVAAVRLAALPEATVSIGYDLVPWGFTVCPLCVGYLMGTLSRLESEGLKRLWEENKP